MTNEHDAHQSLKANIGNGWAYIGKGTAPAQSAQGQTWNSTFKQSIVYLGDESEDIPPHASLWNDFKEYCKRTLIMALVVGALGFVIRLSY